MSAVDRFTKGTRVRIRDTSNPFAKRHIGKTGTVYGPATDPEMVSIDLDDGTEGFWAYPHNLIPA